MALLIQRRSEADRLSAAFSRVVGERAAPSTRAGPLIGIEHEFRVFSGGVPVDFRRVIHTLPIEGRRLDPADSNAYRGFDGGKITCDEREAEIAVAPVARGPGCTATLVERAHAARMALAAALPDDTTLEGYSTHLSVAVSDSLVERTARIYARTFAPALMLLLDGPESPGLLVRPRPGRLELGGEFADGDRLRAAIAFAIGSVIVASRAAHRRPFAGRRLPSAIDLDLQPSRDRYGWFVDRAAAGTDLYASGRSTLLHRIRGGTVTAGAHLASCWAVARDAIATSVDPTDLEAADRIVAGLAPTGVELSQDDAIAFHGPGARAATGGTTMPDPTCDSSEPFGRVTADRRRPGYVVRPVILSWDFAVLALEADTCVAYACLPRELLGAGLEALDAGRLDDLLLGYLAVQSNAEGRELSSSRQTGSPGLYGTIGRLSDLLVPEHGPMGPDTDRPDKRRRDPDDRPDNARSEQSSLAIAGALAPRKAPVERQALGLPIKVAAAAGGLVLLAVVGGVLVLGGQSGPSPTPTEGTQAEAAPPLASPASIAPESVAPIPTGTPALAPGFSGTYDVTAIVSSVEFLGPTEGGPPPPGTTIDYRVEIDCGPAACTLTSGPLPRFDDNGPRWSYFFQFRGGLPLADGGTGLATSSSAPSPSCDTGDVTYSLQLSGTNANQDSFGGFTGSRTQVNERLEGTKIEGGFKCSTVNFVVDFVGTRVGG